MIEFFLTRPKVFLVSETIIRENELKNFLEYIGANSWTTDATSDGEKLIEVAGRLCYKSFSKDLNENLTKVREGNKKYIENIINSGHGSVLEHVNLGFIFCGVSRVFTHELVRHRSGVAISQESLRYVRTSEYGFNFCDSILKEGNLYKKDIESYLRTISDIYFSLMSKFNFHTMDFHTKKKVTSFIRRFLPQGISTNIFWTCNLRELRFVIEKRTDASAEEEIRYVFGEVYKIVKEKYENIFFDAKEEIVDGLIQVKFNNPKI